MCKKKHLCVSHIEMGSRLLFSRSKTDRTNPGGVLFCRTKQKRARTHTRCENWHLFPSMYERPTTSHKALQFPVGKNLTSFSFNENALAAGTAGKHVLRGQLTWIHAVCCSVESCGNVAAVSPETATDLWVVSEASGELHLAPLFPALDELIWSEQNIQDVLD